jgi:hypothetical protein
MSVKHGIIEEIRWSGQDAPVQIHEAHGFIENLQGQKLHTLAQVLKNIDYDLHNPIGSRLSELFPNPNGSVRR